MNKIRLYLYTLGLRLLDRVLFKYHISSWCNISSEGTPFFILLLKLSWLFPSQITNIKTIQEIKRSFITSKYIYVSAENCCFNIATYDTYNQKPLLDFWVPSQTIATLDWLSWLNYFRPIWGLTPLHCLHQLSLLNLWKDIWCFIGKVYWNDLIYGIINVL